MTVYDATGDKSPGTDREPTPREHLLALADRQSRIDGRATRARIDIRQQHLDWFGGGGSA